MYILDDARRMGILLIRSLCPRECKSENNLYLYVWPVWVMCIQADAVHRLYYNIVMYTFYSLYPDNVQVIGGPMRCRTLKMKYQQSEPRPYNYTEVIKEFSRIILCIETLVELCWEPITTINTYNILQIPRALKYICSNRII